MKKKIVFLSLLMVFLLSAICFAMSINECPECGLPGRRAPIGEPNAIVTVQGRTFVKCYCPYEHWWYVPMF
jgi:hypothetical protein